MAYRASDSCRKGGTDDDLGKQKKRVEQKFSSTNNSSEGKELIEEVMELEEDLHALEKLYGLLQIKPGNSPQNSVFEHLDEKAKLVLKRLLDGATRQVFQSQSKILEERFAASSMNNDTKLEGKTPVNKQCFGVVNSNQEPDSHQTTSQSKKRCQNCGKNNKKIMKSAMEKKNLIDMVPNKDHKIEHVGDCEQHLHRRNLGHEKAKGFDHTKEAMHKISYDIRRNQKVGGPGSVELQANWFKPEPECSHLNHNDEKKKPEKMVNVADAIKQFEARIRGDSLVPTQRLVNPIKETNEIRTNKQSSLLNRFLDSKDEATDSTESNYVSSQNRKLVGIEKENELVMNTDHEDDKKQLKKAVDVARAIQQLEARIRGNQLVSSQRVVHSVKDTCPIATTHQSSVMKTGVTPQKSGLTESKLLSSRNSKDVGVPPADNELLPTGMTSRTDRKSKDIVVLNQLVCQNCKKIKVTALNSELLKNNVVVNQLVCPNCKKIKGTALNNEMLNRTRKPVSCVDHMPNQYRKTVSQIGKSVVEKNENPINKPSLSMKPFCQGNNSLSQKNEKRNDNVVPRQVLTHTNTKNQTRQRRASRPPVPTEVMGHTVLKDLMDLPRRLAEKQLPPQNILPTLLDHKPSGIKVEPPWDTFSYCTGIRWNHKKDAELDPRKKVLPHQQRDKRSTSMKSSTSYSYTDSSTTGDTSSSSESSGSEWDPKPGRMLTRRSTRGPRSHSRSSHVGPSTSGSGSSGENYPRRMTSHHSKVGPQHHAGPTTLSKLTNKRKIGRFRRLKNKLAIILHHHHHYHHHHPDGSDSSEDDDAPDHGHRPLWKHVSNVFHRKSRDVVVKDVRKSTARNTTRQKQHGHFHTLLGGLLRHLWGSKKSKPSKADIRRLERTISGKKVAVKKWHWSQNFHKRGLSNSGKRRVKVGFRTKHPQLRGPSKMK